MTKSRARRCGGKATERRGCVVTLRIGRSEIVTAQWTFAGSSRGGHMPSSVRLASSSPAGVAYTSTTRPSSGFSPRVSSPGAGCGRRGRTSWIRPDRGRRSSGGGAGMVSDFGERRAPSTGRSPRTAGATGGALVTRLPMAGAAGVDVPIPPPACQRYRSCRVSGARTPTAQGPALREEALRCSTDRARWRHGARRTSR